MNSKFKSRLVNLVVGCAMCALALAPTLALAGGKGKGHSDHAAYSLSNGGGNSGGSGSSSMKLHDSRSKSLSTFGTSENSGNMFSQSFSAKKSKSFGQLNSNNSSLQNLYTTGGGSGGSGHFTTKKLSTDSSLSGISRRSRKPSLTLTDQHNLADAVQAGKFKPIDSGIGNGTGNGAGTGGGTIKWPGKFTKTDGGTIADSLNKHQFFPVEGIRIGEPNGPGKGNGNGKKKDCHDDCDFPWWPIIVGGCYNGGGCNNNGNCHHHHDCYDNYNGGCYNGGYYNNTTYPSVTNIVIEQPAVAPAEAQATLVTGIDLELLDVRLVDPGDAARNLGPRYRLTFGNKGTLPAGNFQVMLMASVDGTPQAGAPSATSEISGLASRQVFAADVRLPVTAELATMTKFIVVVDSAAQIGEPDENNNVAVLESAKIATVDATTVAVQ